MPEPCLSVTDPDVAERPAVVAGADPAALCEQVLEGLRGWDTAAPRRALEKFHDWFTPTIPSDTPSADKDTATTRAERAGLCADHPSMPSFPMSSSEFREDDDHARLL